MRARIRLLGICVLALGAWGGIVPYVGPLFGYRMATPNAWTWNTVNWQLHLAPGAAAVIAGILMLVGGAWLARLGGWLTLACGGWFVLGPLFASMWLTGAPETRVASSSLMQAARPLGYHYGTGLLLAAAGGYLLAAALPRLLPRTEPYPMTTAAPRAEARIEARPAESDAMAGGRHRA